MGICHWCHALFLLSPCFGNVVRQALQGQATHFRMAGRVNQARFQQHDAEHDGPASGTGPQGGIIVAIEVDRFSPRTCIAQQQPDAGEVRGAVALCNVAPIDDGRDAAVFHQHIAGMEIAMYSGGTCVHGRAPGLSPGLSDFGCDDV